MLQEATILIEADLNQAGECLIRVGMRLIAVKDALAKNGKEQGFVAWCNSNAFPLSYRRAMEYIAVAQECSDGKMNSSSFLSKSGPGHKALAILSKVKDEEIKQALLEHVNTKVESGENVTQSEFTQTLADLKEARAKADQLEDAAFNAKAELEKIKIERDRIAEREKEERKKKDDYYRQLLDASKEKKALKDDMERKLKDKQDELRDAEAVHREHLDEMRKQIAEQERNRPRTDEEEAAHQSRLNDLREQAARVEMDINEKIKERAKLDASLLDLRKETALRDKILSDFAQAAVQFREVALRMSGVGQTLKKIQITDALFDQIDMIRSMASDVVSAMNEAVNV
jgi:chromosome segregation ATPase